MTPPPQRWALPGLALLLACACGLSSAGHTRAEDPPAEAIAAAPSIDPAATARPSPREKLDSHIVQALQKARGEPPFDKPTPLDPGLTIEKDGRVLVDLTATVTKDLLAEIERHGGRVISSFEGARAIRALFPLAHLETLAARPDVQFIAPASEPATNR